MMKSPWGAESVTEIVKEATPEGEDTIDEAGKTFKSKVKSF